jgi:O-antigen/teichoic acid export membrane protein
MLNSFIVLYLGSRGLSAAGNLLAVAIFTRLAGPAEYGHYLLIFAWSLIAYGFTAQWMRFAYFGVYQARQVEEYVASLVQILMASVTVLAIAFTVLAAAGWCDPIFLLAVFAVVCGMTINEISFEVARTRLHARAASLSMILRTCFTVAFGSLTLWLHGGANGLAFALALANALAALPCLAALTGVRPSHASRAAALHILRYGWPLFLSFGVAAIGQTIDRLLLAHFAGPEALGPYGVVADLLRQSFAVLGESISLAMVTIAKQHANEGHIDQANRVLQSAFNACLAAAAFGAVFFIVFGDVIVRVLLGAEFHGPTQDLIPIFAVTFAFMTMRNFYFAQVIYFSKASYLELVLSVVFVAVSSVLSVLLIPVQGARGAAIALMTATILTCLAFVIIGRRYYRMPIDPVGLVGISTLAVLFVLGAQAIGEFITDNRMLLIAEGALFVALGAFGAHRFGLLRSAADNVVAKLEPMPPPA